MSRYSYDIDDVSHNSDEYYAKKSSAMQTFFDYHGCYPEGFDAADEIPAYNIVII